MNPPDTFYFTAERYNNSLKTLVFLNKDELESWSKTWIERESMAPEFLKRLHKYGIVSLDDMYGVVYYAERRIWNGSEWERK